MGIIKISPRGPEHDHHLPRISFIFSQNELVHEENLLLEKSPGDDSDDCQLAEAGCEHVMIEGQTCSIPYELYDLPDFKGILSLETWNFYLTEEERFSLATLLPDMDQETFWVTIKELLTGDNMLFGSPLEKFYNRLKGGLYSPQVTLLREGLQFLQRNEYYLRLRSYHENMAQAFVEMKKVWDRCQPNSSVEERIHMWNSRREHKPAFVVDLNAFPEEDTLNKGDRNVETLQLSKKAEHINESPDSIVLLKGLVCNTKRKAKGVLKLKPIATNLVQNQMMQPLPDKSEEPRKWQPKGVLKIKPKYDPLNQEKTRTKLEQIPADVWGIHAPRISPAQVAFKRDELNSSEKFPILCQINRDGSTYRNPEVIQDRHREELLYAGAGLFKNSKSFQRKPKMTKDVRQDPAEICKERFPLKTNQNLRIYSQEVGQIGECHNKKKNWNHSNSQQNRSIYGSSADPKIEPFHLAPENHQEKRLNAIVSEAGSRISNNCTDKCEILTEPTEPLEHGIIDHTTNVAISGVEKCLMFPITYKRKKPYKKLNQMDSLKHQPVAVNLEPAAPSGTVKPKPMAIKIKFRGWTGTNV